jgi:hypothetical protein
MFKLESDERMLIYILAACLISFLVSLLFAGMKGREGAKIKWTWSLLITFTVYTIAVTSMSHRDGILVEGALILVGAIVGYLLNQIGRWCIDFIAINVMSDNRERSAKGYEPPLG